MYIEGKNYLVIGASSGIGLALATDLVNKQAIVTGVARNPDNLLAAATEMPIDRFNIIACDVSDEVAMRLLLDAARAIGGFDGIAICAGAHEMMPIQLLKAENIYQSMNANLIPVTNIFKNATKLIKKTGGSIVLLSSVAAIRGTAGFMAYSCAKGALISATKVAAVELAKKKIRVNVVIGGVVKTPMSQGWLSALDIEQYDSIDKAHLLGIGQPEDIAGVLAFLMSEDSRWITGTEIIVDGGLSVR